MFGSFRIKLVAALLILALLPLAAAYWSFAKVSDRNVTSSADTRLEAGLRAAVAAYDDQRRDAAAAAEALARDPDFQAALARRDRTALEAMLRRAPELRVETANGFFVGRKPPLASESSVALVGPERRAGTIVASVRIDAALARRLQARSGLSTPDEIVTVIDERIDSSALGMLSGRVGHTGGQITTATIGGKDYRIVTVPLVPDKRVSVGAVTPVSAIAAEQASIKTRLVAGLLASLLLMGLVAFVAGRSIVGSLQRLVAAANSIAEGRLDQRVPVRGRDEFAALGGAFNRMAAQLEARLADLDDERQRLRDANARFGEALAATLDPDQLRAVIVETAVEATGAEGGVLRGPDGSVLRFGDLSAGPGRLQLELTAGRSNFGTLVLHAAAFDTEAALTAASLAGQAVIALENARQHEIVERQALVDELTGLANRRQGDEALETELARTARLGGSVGLILADLDDFKAVNDVHGHPTGDQVLRAFAETLRETVREIDVAIRWGGEEFGVVLPGTDAEGAAQVAERLRIGLGGRPLLSADGIPFHVTASFGVAAAGPDVALEDLVGAADDALYRAKRAGKDRVDVTTRIPAQA